MRRDRQLERALSSRAAAPYGNAEGGDSEMLKSYTPYARYLVSALASVGFGLCCGCS